MSEKIKSHKETGPDIDPELADMEAAIDHLEDVNEAAGMKVRQERPKTGQEAAQDYLDKRLSPKAKEKAKMLGISEDEYIRRGENAKKAGMGLAGIAGAAALTALAVLPNTSDGNKIAPNPEAPITDVVETPDGKTVEVADEKYMPDNPRDMVIEVDQEQTTQTK